MKNDYDILLSDTGSLDVATKMANYNLQNNGCIDLRQINIPLICKSDRLS